MSNVKKKINIRFDKSPSIIINTDEYRKGYKKIKGRCGKIRLTLETTENLNYCKQLTTLVDELQHIIGINGGVMNTGL